MEGNNTLVQGPKVFVGTPIDLTGMRYKPAETAKENVIKSPAVLNAWKKTESKKQEYGGHQTPLLFVAHPDGRHEPLSSFETRKGNFCFEKAAMPQARTEESRNHAASMLDTDSSVA